MYDIMDDVVIQEESSTDVELNVEVLEDKKFAWKERKMGTLKLSEIYSAAGLWKYAERAKTCATWLQYTLPPGGGDKQLFGANFCQLRLCPLCIARRAKKAAYRLSCVLDAVQSAHPDVTYLFLTLTVKNVAGKDLGDTLGQLTKGWDRLCKQRPVKRAVMGWFRAIEITCKDKGYHPHIHAIVAVRSDYFKRSGGLYITQSDWVQRWKQALRVDYDPSVRISKTKAKSKSGDTMAASQAAAVEAAKYTTKSEEYIDDKLGLSEAVQRVTDYTNALHRRRLTAFGGWLKDAAKKLDMEDVEGGDLVHLDDEPVREDVAEIIETYHWNFGAGDYILADREIVSLVVKRKDGEQSEEY